MANETSFFAHRYGVDAKLMNDILAVALSRGGDYADLYFEHRQTSSILFEEQSVKNAGAGTTQGVGIRVVSGDATGYAYAEDLTPEAMRQAAETAAKIARRGDRGGPVAVGPRAHPDLYPIKRPFWEAVPAEKVDII